MLLCVRLPKELVITMGFASGVVACAARRVVSPLAMISADVSSEAEKQNLLTIVTAIS